MKKDNINQPFYSERKGYMPNTHVIEITKEQFNQIEIGDRLIICNDKDSLGYVVYVEEENEER